MRIIRKSLECFYPRTNNSNYDVEEIEQQIGFKLPTLYKAFNHAFDLSKGTKRDLFCYPNGNTVPIGGICCPVGENDLLLGEFFDILGGYNFKKNYYHDEIPDYFPFAHENYFTYLVGIGEDNQDKIIADLGYDVRNIANNIFEFMDRYVVYKLYDDDFNEKNLTLIHKEWDSEYWTFRDGIESF